MAKSWNRTETWAGLIVLAGGGLLLGIAGLFVYMSATAAPLHPNPQGVPASTLAEPAPAWAGAVEQGRAIARAAVSDQNLPGLSVAVGAGGNLVWAEGLGWADLERRVPVTPRTRFRIGTVSTVLTSAAVGLLLEKGRLGLDDEIQAHVPAFPQKEWPVTLRRLMGHLAGVRGDAGDEEPVWMPCRRTAAGLTRFADRPLLFEPGTRYHYSSYGWILVSAAVEAAGGAPFFTFMQQQVFEPLRMADTTADAGTEARPDQATYYFPRFAADPRYGPQPPDEADFSCFAGAAAFVSTPSDLVRFGLAIDRGTLLQPATVHLLQTSQRLPSGEETGYGLGWDLETVEIGGEPAHAISHDGELRGGTVASLLMLRERGIVVAVTSNISHADTASIALAVASRFTPTVRGDGSP